MKKILTISLLLIWSCSPHSVIPETDDPPLGPGPEIPKAEESVSIAYLKTLYNGAPVRITGEYIISGAVVSSDSQGNFYKTLVLDDGTGGIEIKLGIEQIFKLFMIHSRVNVRCNGLWLGSYGGTIQLGTEPWEGYQTQYLSETQTAEHLLADTEFYGEVLPVSLTFGEIKARHISTFVEFDGVQFSDEELGLGWADSGSEESATDRHLVDEAGNTLVVRTSRYALFADKILPDGSGKIEGVLGYFNGTYQFTVCDERKAEFRKERF